ncbi:GNAT family N-acetyltransferase [Microlunatus parietis]|uniref:Mycothiol synthase n=1 Tax=Microlunatus parietis TaxID=682979 RepID=A0A7Y9L9H3_9ACTN|nr:GNAT family N-acetyltransferase [Microlunatus parietis]NYE71789.1 mycothiol synthase [Microlunatus parietis]
MQLRMRRPDLDDLPPLPTGVQRATGADADGLARLLDAAFTKEWTPARVRRELLDEPDVRDTYLVRRGRLAVATASALVRADQPDVGILHWVASDPALRGRGLGLTVTLAVLRRFAADGLAASILHTDDDRLPAISAYLRLGYVPEYPDQRHQDRWSRIFRRLSLRRHAR